MHVEAAVVGNTLTVLWYLYNAVHRITTSLSLTFQYLRTPIHTLSRATILVVTVTMSCFRAESAGSDPSKIKIRTCHNTILTANVRNRAAVSRCALLSGSCRSRFFQSSLIMYPSCVCPSLRYHSNSRQFSACLDWITIQYISPRFSSPASSGWPCDMYRARG